MSEQPVEFDDISSQSPSSSEQKDQSSFIRFLQKVLALFLLFLGRKPKNKVK
jgi:hypothetical protein